MRALCLLLSHALGNDGHALITRGTYGTKKPGELKRSGVDPPLCSSRACLHPAFIAFSVAFVYNGPLKARGGGGGRLGLQNLSSGAFGGNNDIMPKPSGLEQPSEATGQVRGGILCGK